MASSLPNLKTCMICCYSFQQQQSQKHNQSTFIKFHKFCNDLTNFYVAKLPPNIRGAASTRTSSSSSTSQIIKISSSSNDNITLCSDCLSIINSVVDIMEVSKGLEARVGKLQRELLKELRVLQGSMNTYARELKKVEDLVRCADAECLEYLGLDRKRKDEVEWLRSSVVEVSSSLGSYRRNLAMKVKASGLGSDHHHDHHHQLSPKIVKVESIDINDNDNDNPRMMMMMPNDDYVNYYAGPDSDSGGGLAAVGFDSDQRQPRNRTKRNEHHDNNNSSNYSSSSSSSNDSEDESPNRKTVKQSCYKRPATSDPVYREHASQLRKMSKMKRGVVLAALRNKKAVLLKSSKKVTESTTTENVQNDDDDFSYRNKYHFDYKAEEDALDVGGVLSHIVEDKHDGSIHLQCSQCNYKVSIIAGGGCYNKPFRYKLKLIYRHVLGYHLNAYSCSKCDRSFTAEQQYMLHLKSHNQLDAEPVVCGICGRTLASKQALEKHLVTHMSAEEKHEAKKSGPFKKRKNEPESSDGNFLCPVCGKSFRSSKESNRHCSSSSSKHDDPRDNNIVVCQVCGKSMSRKSYNRYHKKYTCGSEPLERVTCWKCGETFKHNLFLKRHMVRCHGGEDGGKSQPEPVQQCEVCGKSFKFKNDLKHHMDLHSDVVKWSCDVCGKGFTVKRYWSRHQRACVRGEETTESGRRAGPKRAGAAAGGGGSSGRKKMRGENESVQVVDEEEEKKVVELMAGQEGQPRVNQVVIEEEDEVVVGVSEETDMAMKQEIESSIIQNPEYIPEYDTRDNL